MIWYVNVWTSNNWVGSWILLFVVIYLVSSSILFHSVVSHLFGLCYVCRHFILHIHKKNFSEYHCYQMKSLLVFATVPAARLSIIRLTFSFLIQLHWSDTFSICRTYVGCICYQSVYIKMRPCAYSLNAKHILFYVNRRCFNRETKNEI